MSDIYNVLIPEKYNNANGEEKTLWHRVGTAFPHQDGDGFNIVLTPGISVSGRVTVLPRNKDESHPTDEASSVDG